MERKLEEGLEESMAGSDPVSITQPAKSKIDKQRPGQRALPLSGSNGWICAKAGLLAGFCVARLPAAGNPLIRLLTSAWDGATITHNS